MIVISVPEVNQIILQIATLQVTAMMVMVMVMEILGILSLLVRHLKILF